MSNHKAFKGWAHQKSPSPPKSITHATPSSHLTALATGVLGVAAPLTPGDSFL